MSWIADFPSFHALEGLEWFQADSFQLRVRSRPVWASLLLLCFSGLITSKRLSSFLYSFNCFFFSHSVTLVFEFTEDYLCAAGFLKASCFQVLTWWPLPESSLLMTPVLSLIACGSNCQHLALNSDGHPALDFLAQTTDFRKSHSLLFSTHRFLFPS